MPVEGQRIIKLQSQLINRWATIAKSFWSIHRNKQLAQVQHGPHVSIFNQDVNLKAKEVTAASLHELTAEYKFDLILSNIL
jgi:hypothetical protein